MQSFVDSYKNKDKRNMQDVLNRFSAFLVDNKKTGLTFRNLTAPYIEDL